MHIGLCYAEPLGDPGSYGLRSPGRAAEKIPVIFLFGFMSELPVAKDADFPTADNPAYWGFSRGASPENASPYMGITDNPKRNSTFTARHGLAGRARAGTNPNKFGIAPRLHYLCIR